MLEWLGYLWGLKAGYLQIPDRRMENTRVCLRNLIESLPVSSARKLAQFAGKIISMCPVLGKVCLLKTKVFFQCIETRNTWDSEINISHFSECTCVYLVYISGIHS